MPPVFRGGNNTFPKGKYEGTLRNPKTGTSGRGKGLHTIRGT